MTTSRRSACLIIEAAPGYRRAANALVRRAARAVGLQGKLMGRQESASYGMEDTRFIVDCTDVEFERLMAIGKEMANAEGWERFPVDAYHD